MDWIRNSMSWRFQQKWLWNGYEDGDSEWSDDEEGSNEDNNNVEL